MFLVPSTTKYGKLSVGPILPSLLESFWKTLRHMPEMNCLIFSKWNRKLYTSVLDVFWEGLKSLSRQSNAKNRWERDILLLGFFRPGNMADKTMVTLYFAVILDEDKWLDSLNFVMKLPDIKDQTTYLNFPHFHICFQEGLVLSCDFLCNLLLLSFSSKWLDLVYCRTATHFVVPRPAIKFWAIAKLSRYPCHPPFVTHLRFPCLASEESCEAVSDTERRVLPRSQIWGRHFLLDRCFCSE